MKGSVSQYFVMTAKEDMKVIDMKHADFNDFFYTYHNNGMLIARWMDNGLVFLV